jgi:SAM-dependent methyltransferase
VTAQRDQRLIVGASDAGPADVSRFCELTTVAHPGSHGYNAAMPRVLPAVAGALVLLTAGCGPMIGLDVPFRGTPPAVVDAMLRLAEVTPADTVYDLGSGDGRIPLAAARDFGARAVGIDIDAYLIRRSTEAATRAGLADRVRFENQDLFVADFREATVVTLYLSPEFNQRLRPRLQAMPRGTRIVSQRHDMGDWRPAKEIEVVAEGRPHRVMLWVVGAPP